MESRVERGPDGGYPDAMTLRLYSDVRRWSATTRRRSPSRRPRP